MSEDEKAKLQRNLRHAVVQSWMISNLAVAVLVAAIPIDHAQSSILRSFRMRAINWSCSTVCFRAKRRSRAPNQ